MVRICLDCGERFFVEDTDELDVCFIGGAMNYRRMLDGSQKLSAL